MPLTGARLGSYEVLGHTYRAMGQSEAPERTVPLAREAAQRALQLDPGVAVGHTSLGIIKLMYDWDSPAAKAEFRRAIALRPGDICVRPASCGGSAVPASIRFRGSRASRR